MSDPDLVTFYHAVPARSAMTRALLEELGAPYEVKLLDLKAGDQLKPDYLAVNPMGKAPAIVHRGVLVTEQPAIFIYLADAFPQKGLAPAIGDPARGTYLRWLVFYSSCVEPAMVDRAMKREPGGRAMVGYGDFDTMFATLQGALRPGPWLLGERFSAADVLWGGALGWMTRFNLIPDSEEIAAYVARCAARPGARRARELDAPHMPKAG